MSDSDQTITPVDENVPPKPSLSLLRAAVLVLVYALAVYLPFLGSQRRLTAHEVMVAHPAMEMLNHDHWLVPMYAGESWIRKPPLVPWVTAGVMAVAGGFSEYVVRLPAALSAVGLCLLVTVITNRFVNARAALFAGLVQASCIYAYMQGRLGEIDMVLALLVASAHAVLLWHWGTGQTKLPLSAAALFHVLCGLVLMTKGPVGIAMIGGTVIGFCVVRRSIKPLLAITLTPALLLSGVVGLSWFFAVYAEIGSDALNGWIYTNIARAAGQHAQGSKHALFYLYTVPWLMLPWGLALVAGGKFLWQRVVPRVNVDDSANSGDAGGWFDRYLWIWFIVGIALLSLSQHKHHHYSIPALIPLSALCGIVLDEHVKRAGGRARRFYTGAFAANLAALLVVGGVMMPRSDNRATQASLLLEWTSQLPADEPLYLAEFEQSFVYAYIRHDCNYLNNVSDLRDQMIERNESVVWLLAARDVAGRAKYAGLSFEPVHQEPSSEERPIGKRLVIGRVNMSADLPKPNVQPRSIGDLLNDPSDAKP